MSQIESQDGKWVIGAGHAFFIGFIIMAALTFRERAFVADNAFHIFTMLRTGTFAVFQERYSIIINQLLPVAGIKLQAPLNAILVLHTISIPVFCYACFALAAHALKNYRTALAIVLGACLLVTQSFYFLFEMHQVVSLLLLLHGFMLNREQFRPYHWVLLAVGLVLAFFLHPLALIGFLFLSGYTVLQQDVKALWQKNKRLLLIILAGLAIVAIRSVFFSNPYEQQKTPGIGSLHLMLKVYRFQVTPYFLKWLLQDYYWLLLFSFFITWHYLQVKKWLQLGFYWASLTGFILLLLAVQKDSNESIRYYLELHYQILALIVVIPMVYEVLPPFFRKPWLPVLVVLLLISRFFTFYTHRAIFADRLKWYDKVYDYTSQFPETKFIINEANVPGLKAQNQLLWASANESLLYFASTGREPQKSIFIAGNTNAFEYLASNATTFASTFESFPAADLPAQYFKLAPSPYRFMNTIANETSLPEAVTITPMVKQLSGKKGKIVQIPVQIRSAALLPSGVITDQPFVLGYRLYQNGAEIAAHTIRTPLEIDITGTYLQNLMVEAPAEPGTYQVIPVLLPYEQNLWQAPVVELDVQ